MHSFALATLLSCCMTGQVSTRSAPTDEADWGRFAFPEAEQPVAPPRRYVLQPPPGQLKRGQTPGQIPGWINIHPRSVTLPPMPAAPPKRPLPPVISFPAPKPAKAAAAVPKKLPGPTGVRRNLSTLDDNSQTVQSFRRAIDAMRRLPADDPHSLAFQSNIHGFDPVDNPHALWGQCQHGNWWFFPWHRAYLHYLERIMRRYADDPTFALPYWDYSDPQARTLPAIFRDPASPLYDSTRRPEVNSGSDRLNDAIVVAGTNASMANTVFADFGDRVTFGGTAMNAPSHASRPHGALESVPHDLVHGFVGGNMSSPNRASRDPVFLTHHANVDRLWMEWLAMGQGRANPSNDVWLNQRFTFYDENKQQVSIAVRDLLDTNQLGYTYDSVGTPARSETRLVARTASETLVKVTAPGLDLSRTAMTVTLKIPQDNLSKARKVSAAGRMSLTPVPTQVLLRVDDVRFSAEPDSTLAVYVDLPREARPDPLSPYFAGCLTFFDHSHGKDHAWTSQLDLTRHLQKLWPYSDKPSKDVRVTLVRMSCGTLPHDFQTTCTCSQISLAACK